MLNNYTMTIGFLAEEPKLTENTKKEQYCLFTLVTQDQGAIKEITCIVTGKMADVLMIYGQKGSFWAVGGIFHDFMQDNSKKKKMCLKCLEMELLKKPEVPGIGIEEFVGKYSPKQIIKRARERRNGKN